jgi:hypothetical protein
MAQPNGNPPNPLVFYTPSARIVTSITSADPCVITTSVPHGYQPGVFVYLFIPFNSPFNQLNSHIFLATILSPTTFSIPVDSRPFQPFVASSTQKAQVCPAGEQANTLDNAANVVLL